MEFKTLANQLRTSKSWKKTMSLCTAALLILSSCWNSVKTEHDEFKPSIQVELPSWEIRNIQVHPNTISHYTEWHKINFDHINFRSTDKFLMKGQYRKLRTMKVTPDSIQWKVVGVISRQEKK